MRVTRSPRRPDPRSPASSRSLGRARLDYGHDVTLLGFDYRSRSPTGPLGRAIESVWYARGTVPYARERISPTGSTVAVIVLGDAIRQVADDGDGMALESDTGLLIGPHDRPIINEPTGETHAVGIITTPVGAEAALGIRPAVYRGRVGDLLCAWPAAGELRARVRVVGDPDAMLGTVLDRLQLDLDLGVPALDRCEAAVALLEADPTCPMSTVAEGVHVSTSQLGRDFARVVGMSPRVLARLLRVRRLLERIDARGPVDWGARASELGWYDQAHLIRDFRRHTGVTPTAYLEAQRTYEPSDEDTTAGFVPEIQAHMRDTSKT